METKFILQKLAVVAKDEYGVAERYYNVLSVLNDLKLTEREVQLVAFTAVRGNISYANIREDFCKRYKTSSPTINNMISRLKKINVLIKEGGKVKVNPVIMLKFDGDVVLQIHIKHE